MRLKSAPTFCIKPKMPARMPTSLFILFHTWLAHIHLRARRIFLIFMFRPSQCSLQQVITQMSQCLILRVRALNYLTHVISKKITWWTSSFGFEQVRRRAGLPKRKLYLPFEENSHRPPTPILCAWSPDILPPSNDWKTNVHTTGYYFFDTDEAYQAPAELQSFLEAAKPPVCVSFGSMVNRNAERIDRVVREALTQTNNRGIVLSGWGGIKDRASENMLYLDAVPHDWLLPRCRMVIHHGGAGTTSAGLRAGIPNIVVPFTADQPFWGRRIHAIGAGPRPVPVNRLTTERLMQAIVEAEGEAVRRRAQVLGRRVRSEEGVNNAVSLIEAHLENFWKF
jgi:sterol 3beta-glucosyltransferase